MVKGGRLEGGGMGTMLGGDDVGWGWCLMGIMTDGEDGSGKKEGGFGGLIEAQSCQA